MTYHKHHITPIHMGGDPKGQTNEEHRLMVEWFGHATLEEFML